jgi:diguanylate cyclase (GGDEF)-like protein/PAS domain S-box-containing protein
MRIDDPDIFRGILENLQIGLYLTDRDRRIVFWNREATRISGYLSHEVVGRCCHDGMLTHCDAEGKILCISDCPMTKAMQEGAPQEAGVYLQHKSGHRVPVRVRAFPVRRLDGAVIGAVEMFEEQSSSLLSSRREEMLAAHGLLDPATRLPNHAIMQSYLRENLNLYREHHLPFGVLVIEIEHVKQFVDAHSREALTVILHVVARSISHQLGSDCWLGPWSGNQFLALVPGCSLLDLERIRKQIRELVSCSAVQWWGEQLSVAVQVGYAMVEAEDEPDRLLARAQQSLQSHAARDKTNSTLITPGSNQPSGS